MKYSEKWGDSIDAAVNLALQDLKLTRDKVTITVLEQPSKGFFGIGSKLAKVRVEEIVPVKEKKPEKEKKQKTETVKAPKEEPKKEIKNEKSDEEVSEDAKEVKKTSKKKNSGKNKKVKTEKAENTDIETAVSKISVSAKPEDLEEVAEHPAKEFLEKTFKEMGIEVSLKVFVNKDSVYVDVEGKDTGTVIGKRGSTLDALQYLTSLVVNKGEKEYSRVIVDAEGYRAKRESTLEKLAFRMADKVRKNGRSMRLEPMNPYERKVIHSTLQNSEGINTRSEGDEPYRRVVIEPKK